MTQIHQIHSDQNSEELNSAREVRFSEKFQAMDIHSYLSVSTSAEINRLPNGWFKALSSHRSQTVLPRVMPRGFLLQ